MVQQSFGIQPFIYSGAKSLGIEPFNFLRRMVMSFSCPEPDFFSHEAKIQINDYFCFGDEIAFFFILPKFFVEKHRSANLQKKATHSPC
jgi:hypothetical protein